MIRRLLLLLAVLIVAGPAAAHEVRPGYLEISQPAPGRCHFLWKQPAIGEMAPLLTPVLSNGWLDRAPDSETHAPGYLLRAWDIACPDPKALAGQTLSVIGLEGTITDVLVHADLGAAGEMETILRPDRTAVKLDFGEKTGLAAIAYLRLGVEHILTGIDHLSFVLGLLLLVGFRWRLLKAITAFTVAHSITLAATALGVVHVPSVLVEAMVAMSILFLAAELVRSRRGQPGLTSSHPWMIAFSFGLLHGFAFAGALAEVGLPRDAIPLSLFLFNVGVEIGQLIFVGAVGAVFWLAARAPRLPAPARVLAAQAPPYVIGSLAAFWLLERLGPIFA